MTDIQKKLGDMVDNALDAVGINDESENQGKGWHGDHEAHVEAGKQAAETAEKRYGEDFHETIGAKGGRAAQRSGNAHELTAEEQSEGGKS